MAATFSRLKDWVAEVLTYEDLNAEIDNILANLGPAGIGSYSANTMEYQETVSPINGDGTPNLPEDLAGEITRLRYQILAIMGTDADNWYDFPSTTLSGINTLLSGSAVPASRIESIDSDSYVNLLIPDGTVPTVTLKGSTNNIVYFINGIRYQLTSDISLTGMSLAPTTSNTATFNDSTLSGTQASTYAGEYETVMTLASVGTNITAQVGNYQAYKVVHLGVTEYFTGYYNTTGTKIEKARRGSFFKPDTSASSRVIISNSDVITVQRLAWIYLRNDNTLSLTYNTPIYAFDQPSGPSIGDFWFDYNTTTWKVYSALGFNESNAVLIGQAVIDGTACVAARSVEPFRLYSTENEMDIEVGTSLVEFRLKNLQSSLSVYARNYNWGARSQSWNAAALEIPGSLSANTTYYAYVKDDADFVLSTFAPHDRRGDLGGFYHPSHSWRGIGYATTDGSSLFIPTSLIVFSRGRERSFFTNSVEDLSIQTRTIIDGVLTYPKFSAINKSISGAASLNQVLTATTYYTVPGLSASITPIRTNPSIKITIMNQPNSLLQATALVSYTSAGTGNPLTTRIVTRCRRNGTDIGYYSYSDIRSTTGGNTALVGLPLPIVFYDNAATPGVSQTYDIQVAVFWTMGGTPTVTFFFTDAVMQVEEER